MFAGRWGALLTNAASGTSHDLYNNALIGRLGLFLDGNVDTDLLNSIVVSADTAEHGIYVNATSATPGTVAIFSRSAATRPSFVLAVTHSERGARIT